MPSLSVSVEVSARLFDSANRYLGTVGLPTTSHEKAQQNRLTELESRLQETDRQLTLTREAARVSRQLQQPLTTLLQDSQRLLTSIQHSRIEQHVETMVAKSLTRKPAESSTCSGHVCPPSELTAPNLNEHSPHRCADGPNGVRTGEGIRVDLGRTAPGHLGSTCRHQQPHTHPHRFCKTVSRLVTSPPTLS